MVKRTKEEMEQAEKVIKESNKESLKELGYNVIGTIAGVALALGLLALAGIDITL